jgi:hypothetical protein
MDPGFRRKGYPRDQMTRRKGIVRDLIDRFNAMVQGIETMPDFDHVRFVDLRGTLPNGAGYEKWWDNELHPTRQGFVKVTQKFADTLAALP